MALVPMRPLFSGFSVREFQKVYVNQDERFGDGES